MRSEASSETSLAQAKRHIRRGETLIARQLRLVLRLECGRCHPAAAEAARGLLATLRKSLALYRDYHRLRMRELGWPTADLGFAGSGARRRPLSPEGRKAMLELLLHAILHERGHAIALLSEMLENEPPPDGTDPD